MADADVAITAGSGTKIDTRTVGAGVDEHRQVIVIGDPTTAANVAVVNAAGLVAVLMTHAAASTATLANVAASATSVSLRSAATGRLGLLLVNESTAVLYLKFGATASLTSYSVAIAAGGYWEMPRPIYTGAIDGIWSSATGTARITELT